MVRREIGPDAVIIQNKAVAEGVAVTAIAEADLALMEVPAETIVVAEPTVQQAVSGAADASTISATAAADTGMSTVQFQQFANERKAQRSRVSSVVQATTQEQRVGMTHRSVAGEVFSPATTDPSGGANRNPVADRSDQHLADELTREIRSSEPHSNTRFEYKKSDPVQTVPEWSREETDATPEMQRMVYELRKMRSFISQQFSALAWVDGVRRTPEQAALLRLMIEGGFSARLARVLVGRLPDNLTSESAHGWLQQSLVRNLRCACFDDGLLERGGVFALVGPTGVGKTTSAAKLAARFAARHGADAVGLISADAYRIAGQDQLIRYGRMIGAAVHTARDAEDLGVQLDRLQDKALVLIDTAGLGQRDPRVSGLLTDLSQGAVQRLMVVSASAQAEVLDETLDAYRAEQAAGIVLTKTDEACLLGGALDVLIRQRLPLLAVGTGQRVPEDWASPDPDALINQALSMAGRAGQDLNDIELTMLMQRVESQANGPLNQGARSNDA
jgi:flagellar biosynthesis protein FlhF